MTGQVTTPDETKGVPKLAETPPGRPLTIDTWVRAPVVLMPPDGMARTFSVAEPIESIVKLVKFTEAAIPGAWFTISV